MAEAQAWLEPTKGDLGGTLDPDFLPQIEVRVLSAVAVSYNVTTWVDNVTTPQIVRVCIAMKYVAWYYRRQYSEEGETNQYADLLDASADATIEGIVNGTIIISEVPVSPTGDISSPVFYPTDASSALNPLDFPDDQSVGPAHFSMNKIF